MKYGDVDRIVDFRLLCLKNYNFSVNNEVLDQLRKRNKI
jgi:hypothetical protein